jgi:hypothetical protein
MRTEYEKLQVTPGGKEKQRKLQETANGKLKMPTGKARNQIQRQLVRR